MKILFTTGGSGGHFYPIIAIAEAVHEIVHEKKYIEPKLYYAAPDPYNADLLFANNITFLPTAAGKLRRDASVLNFFLNFIDLFKTLWGSVKSLWRLFFLYPDVVLGGGGGPSFPTLLAARVLHIPVIIYSTDAEPSRVNRWAGTFAKKVAVSFPEAEKYFPKNVVAYTGNPIRKTLLLPVREGIYEFLKLSADLPVIVVLGGSQGAQAINEVVLGALPTLLEKYQVVHQTGAANLDEVTGRARIILTDNPNGHRYKPFGYLDALAMRMAAGAAKLVVSRAGAGGIFEIATWALPSIIIPIPQSISHDQTRNAYSYARAGAAVVIEQNNLTPGVLVSEIERILNNREIAQKMSIAAKGFSRPDAARTIADALLTIAISHEK